MLPFGMVGALSWILIFILFWKLKCRGRIVLAIWVGASVAAPYVVRREYESMVNGFGHAARVFAAVICLIWLSMPRVSRNPFA